MRKAIKYSFISIISIILLFAIGLVLIVTLVNPNQFKPYIEKAVNDSLGRKITLAGDITWKIYPNLGVTIKGVTLSNPQGFAESNFMTLNSADVSVALLPLLSHNVVIKTLAIDGLNLALIKQNGINNWSFNQPTPATQATPGEKPKPIKLEMSAFSFTNGAISYDDRDSLKHYAVKNSNLIINTGFNGTIKYDQALDSVILSKVNLKYNDEIAAIINLDATQLDNPKYNADVNFSKLRLNQLLDEFAIAKEQRKGMNLLDNVIFSGNFKGESQRIDIKGFNFNLSDKFKGSTDIQVNNFANPSYKGSIELESFNLNQLLDSANIAVKARKDKPLLNKFSIQSSGFSGDKNNIALKNIKLSAGGLLNVSFGSLQVKNFANPTVYGDINVANTNLNQVLDGLNIAVKERKNKPLLNKFAFSSGGFNADKNNASFKNIKLSVGGILNPSLNSLQVQNFANPSVSGDINLPNTNLNQVLDGLGIAVNERKNKPLLNNFAVKTNFQAGLNNLNLKNTSFSFGKTLTGSSNVNVQNFSNPQISGNINLPSFSVNTVMQQVGMTPPDISNKKLLDSVALNTGFAATSNSFSLNHMQTKLSNSNITGDVKVGSFKPLAVNENITIDQMDVADFSNINGYRVPMKQLHFNGNINVASNMDFKTLNGKQNVQIGNISISGISLDRLVLQLNSIVNTAGNVSGNDIAKIVMNTAQATQAITKMKTEIGQAAKPGPKDLSQKTNLGTFTGALTIVNGLVSPSSFKLVGPSAGLNGNGSVNLVSKALNYKVNSQLLVNGINPMFKKLVFPSTVSGTINDPHASLDWTSIQSQILSYVVANNKQQIQKAVSNQINQAVGNQVKKAIGNDQGNEAVDKVSKGITNAIGNLFGK